MHPKQKTQHSATEGWKSKAKYLPWFGKCESSHKECRCSGHFWSALVRWFQPSSQLLPLRGCLPYSSQNTGNAQRHTGQQWTRCTDASSELCHHNGSTYPQPLAFVFFLSYVAAGIMYNVLLFSLSCRGVKPDTYSLLTATAALLTKKKSWNTAVARKIIRPRFLSRFGAIDGFPSPFLSWCSIRP